MRMDDMILVSIDDHSIEPPDMYDRHVPAKWRDQAPKIVRNDEGVDLWVFQGQATSTHFGLAATVGWPPEEWGFNPGTFSEMRPGCFDVHERVRDMNANGVLASMCFPTMAGFNARTFVEAGDRELSFVMLQAYNDWHIEEWCAAYPGRLLPLAIGPLWDVELLAAATQTARDLAKKPPAALQASKRLMRSSTRELLERAVKLENQEFSVRARSAEAKEAFNAFLEKRKPNFDAISQQKERAA